MPFKTAAELGLREVEYCGLIKTLAALEDGTVGSGKQYPPNGGHGFNMALWHLNGGCGTVGCLAGTAELLGEFKFSGNKKTSGELGRLFIPIAIPDAISCTDPAKGAKALRGYLTTGKADWAAALKE